jgi:hypothetical protein
LNQDHFVKSVDFLQADRYFLLVTGRYVLADVVRTNWQLAVPAVDEADKLDGARPTEVDQRIESRADGAAGVQDVVDQDDRLVRNVDRDRGRAERPRRALVDVVTVQGDVELAEWNLGAFKLQNPLLQTPRKRYAARP